MVTLINHDNALLDLLPAEDFEALRPHLRGMLLRPQSVLFDAGETVSKAYFPHRGAVSLGVVLTGGDMIGTALVGRTGTVGAAAALTGAPAPCRAVVEIEGAAAAIETDLLRDLAEKRPPIRILLQRHEQELLAQSHQIAACNAAHGLEARFCRWLLVARQVTGGLSIPVTQERIGELLGVRRTSVCLVAHTLQSSGFIRTRRGQIELLDEESLRIRACECRERLAVSAASLGTPALEPVARRA